LAERFCLKKNKTHRPLHRSTDLAKDGEVSRLKRAIKRLQAEKQKLIAELATLEAAFKKNLKFLEGLTRGLSMSDLIEAAKNKTALKKIIDDKPELDVTIETALLESNKKQQQLRCEKCKDGNMVRMLFTNRGGSLALLKCNKIGCDNRTTASADS